METMMRTGRREKAAGWRGVMAAAALVVGLIVTHHAGANTIVIDNDDPAFSFSGAWTASNNGNSFDGGHRYNNDGGTGSATWSFTGLDAGLYDVLATWAINDNRSQAAPFELGDGGPIVTVNQELLPDADLLYKDTGNTERRFQRLGQVTIPSDGGSVDITLTDDASTDLSSFVIADAVALVLVPEPSGLTIALLLVGGALLRRGRR